MTNRPHSRATPAIHPAAHRASVRAFRVARALAFAALALATLGASPQPPDSSDALPEPLIVEGPGHEVLPAVPHPFLPGESLKFTVQYGMIHAGNAWLEVLPAREWQGRDVIGFRARAESNAFFSKFYKVRNVIESTWDRRGQFSCRYTEDRREGGRRTHNDITFDHARHEARYGDGTVVSIPPQVQDALSSFYYTRFQALPIGGSVIFDYHNSKRSQPLRVKVLGRDKVSVPAGKFSCVVIEPELKAGGIFRNNGRLVIWLTDDERRMPVLMKSKVSVGSISVVLTEWRRGGT
jgi:uncharacterized protein DUF3108